MAKLVCQSGARAGHEYPLRKTRTVFGRLQECDVVIVDPKSSREHFAIHRHGQLFSVQDLGSRNGTKLNDQRVRECLLKYGDRLRVGNCEYTLVKEDGDLELGDLLSKYEIEEKVGEGGMGIVFRARQRSMDRLVALKVLSPHHASRQHFIDQFIEEARAVGSLSHPNLIQVHEVGTENDVHYFSMEFINGPTCANLLKSHGKLDPGTAVEIGRQTAKALEYAHGQNLVHRDIKPDNLMLTPDEVIKVADLGISKTAEELAAGSGSSIVGTPHYLAPEATRGEAIDGRYDIYSLGASLYHLLAGKPPYSGKDASEIIRAHARDSLRPLRQVAPEVPPELAKLVERMLAKDPADRPQSASELVRAFETLQQQLGYSTQGTDDGTLLLKQLASTPRRPKSEPRSDSDSSLAGSSNHRLINLLIIAGFVLLLAGIAYKVASRGSGDQNGQEEGVQLLAPGASPSVTPPSNTTPLPNPSTIPDASPQGAAENQATQHAWQDQVEQLRQQFMGANTVDALTILQGEQQRLASLGMTGQAADNLQILGERITTRLSERRQIAAQTAFSQIQDQVYLHMNAKRFAEAEQLLQTYLTSHGEHAVASATALHNDLEHYRQQEHDKLQRSIEQAIAQNDETTLSALRTRVENTLRDETMLQSIDQALIKLQASRTQQRQVAVEEVRNALAAWQLAEAESLTRSHMPNAVNTPEATQLQELTQIANDLVEMIASIDRGLKPRSRFSGQLQFLQDPWLTGANRKGLQAEITSGTVTVAWRDLSEAQWQQLLQLATPTMIRDHQRLLEERSTIIQTGGGR